MLSEVQAYEKRKETNAQGLFPLHMYVPLKKLKELYLKVITNNVGVKFHISR